ncbi:MAG: hypothetical protein KKD38_01630 [Candidatus Delongbacteria bacterium]|nr:hypothetical protein [Candidatus Delongbacteria bacterium]MCG2760204.1 hypothetical protein [Candidatus Delongbacteria bacterium]
MEKISNDYGVFMGYLRSKISSNFRKKLNYPDFKGVEFDPIKKEVGYD